MTVDWMKIGSALLLIMMIVFIYPSAKHWLTNSPKGSSSDWISAIIAIAAVGVFVAFLVALV